VKRTWVQARLTRSLLSHGVPHCEDVRSMWSEWKDSGCQSTGLWSVTVDV